LSWRSWVWTSLKEEACFLESNAKYAEGKLRSMSDYPLSNEMKGAN